MQKKIKLENTLPEKFFCNILNLLFVLITKLDGYISQGHRTC